MNREVTVDWVQKPGKNPAQQLQREIGWEGIESAMKENTDGIAAYKK